MQVTHFIGFISYKLMTWVNIALGGHRNIFIAAAAASQTLYSAGTLVQVYHEMEEIEIIALFPVFAEKGALRMELKTANLKVAIDGKEILHGIESLLDFVKLIRDGDRIFLQIRDRRRDLTDGIDQSSDHLSLVVNPANAHIGNLHVNTVPFVNSARVRVQLRCHKTFR